MVSAAQAFASVQLSARVEPGLGVGIVLQGKMGARPSEMLGIVASDLVFPEESGCQQGKGPLIVGLGMKANAKAKRPQSDAILECENPILAGTPRPLKARAAQGGHLFPCALLSSPSAFYLWGGLLTVTVQ
eukprot:7867101-Pyramimonas_sp.AAC.1